MKARRRGQLDLFGPKVPPGPRRRFTRWRKTDEKPQWSSEEQRHEVERGEVRIVARTGKDWVVYRRKRLD